MGIGGCGMATIGITGAGIAAGGITAACALGGTGKLLRKADCGNAACLFYRGIAGRRTTRSLVGIVCSRRLDDGRTPRLAASARFVIGAPFCFASARTAPQL